MLVPREKSKDELQREEEEYQEFLRREVGEDLHQLVEVDPDVIGIHENVPDGEGEGRKRKKKGKNRERKSGQSKTKEDKEKNDQEFLMKYALNLSYSTRKLRPFSSSYILNRGWIDRSAKRLPTYTEVTSVRSRKKPGDEEGGAADSSGSSSDPEVGGGADNLIEDPDEFDDVADAFESSYNFRFEEPYVVFSRPLGDDRVSGIYPLRRSAAEIARHPRNLTSTVRRQDTTRKEARERRKARKEEELLQKREEVKRLKALKLKELRRKLERIGQEGGLEDIDQHQGITDLEPHFRRVAESSHYSSPGLGPGGGLGPRCT